MSQLLVICDCWKNLQLCNLRNDGENISDSFDIEGTSYIQYVHDPIPYHVRTYTIYKWLLPYSTSPGVFERKRGEEKKYSAAGWLYSYIRLPYICVPQLPKEKEDGSHALQKDCLYVQFRGRKEGRKEAVQKPKLGSSCRDVAMVRAPSCVYVVIPALQRRRRE